MADNIFHVSSVMNNFTQKLSEGKMMLTKQLLDDDVELLSNIYKSKHNFLITRKLLDVGDTLINKKIFARANASEHGVVEFSDNEMSEIYSNLARVSHLIKLPYKYCVFEKEALSWAFELSDGAIGRRLVYAQDNPLEVGEEYSFTLISAGYDTVDGVRHLALPNHVTVVTPNYLLSENPSKFIKHLSFEEDGDITDILSLKIIGVLLALNSPRITSQTESDKITVCGGSKTKPKKAKVITVDVSKELKESLKSDDELEEDCKRKGCVAHFVRGHFKTKPSGVYWWNAFVRGAGVPDARPYKLKS